MTTFIDFSPLIVFNFLLKVTDFEYECLVFTVVRCSDQMFRYCKQSMQPAVSKLFNRVKTGSFIQQTMGQYRKAAID